MTSITVEAAVQMLRENGECFAYRITLADWVEIAETLGVPPERLKVRHGVPVDGAPDSDGGRSSSSGDRGAYWITIHDDRAEVHEKHEGPSARRHEGEVGPRPAVAPTRDGQAPCPGVRRPDGRRPLGRRPGVPPDGLCPLRDRRGLTMEDGRCRLITFHHWEKLRCTLPEAHPRTQDHVFELPEGGVKTTKVEPTIHICRVTGARTEEWHNP